jgi:hypothetical protein
MTAHHASEKNANGVASSSANAPKPLIRGGVGRNSTEASLT